MNTLYVILCSCPCIAVYHPIAFDLLLSSMLSYTRLNNTIFYFIPFNITIVSLAYQLYSW